jgi:hypothetical protein
MVPLTGAAQDHEIGSVALDPVAQRKPAPAAPGGLAQAPNRTGLPAPLKAGLESLSGLRMDRVRVHYRSAEPARLQAHAFTRGTDIHLAPGQDHHLAHEAWHVVQQARGRVRPTLQIGGARVNDDAALEREADRLGAASAARGAALLRHRLAPPEPGALSPAPRTESGCVQRVLVIGKGPLAGEYSKKAGKATDRLIRYVEREIDGALQRGWKGGIRKLVGEDTKRTLADTKSLLSYVAKRWPARDRPNNRLRPNFPTPSYRIGAISHGIQTGTDQSGLKPAEENLALPHRFPYASIQWSTEQFISGQETATDLERWSDRLLLATKERLALNLPSLSGDVKAYYKKIVEGQIEEFGEARTGLEKAVANGDTLQLGSAVVQRFLKVTNALHGNIPDYGPHEGVNIQVSNRLHLHILSDGTLTPGSKAAGSMTPKRVPKGIAYTSDKGFLVTTDGRKVAVSDLKKIIAQQLSKHAVGATSIAEEDLEELD